ncbi:MAG TPA: ATP-binding protein [Kofleriaceae bacterium]|nr:ATP-binding protein [Kofleriaceae bacterium]
MSSTAALVELGDRYAALGLGQAARAAFERALGSAGTDDPVPARRLAELALAAGDADGARHFAQTAAARRGGAAARLLLGRAQLAAGELAAARFSFAQVLEAPGAGPLLRARALLGRTQVALAEDDQPGAVATCQAAIDGLIAFAEAPGRRAEEIEVELPLLDEAIIVAVAAGCGDEIERRIDESAAAGSTAPCHLLRALVRGHRQAQGDAAPDDAAVERELEAALAERPGSRAIRMRLGERRLRRRRGTSSDDAARQRALADLEALAADMSGDPVGPVESVELARVFFLLGSAYGEDPAQLERSERAYREGLRRRPGHAGAANQLALLALARGDLVAAIEDIELALRIDAAHGLSWRSAARVLEASSPGAALPGLVGRILDAAWPGAGSAAGRVAPRLVTAMAEVARGDVLAGIHTRGHRVKNLLGIAAARARSARKLAAFGAVTGDVSERIAELERDLTGLYDEWAAFLRSMQAAGPRLEILPVAPLLVEVVGQASAASSAGAVPVELKLAPGLPDLRGDRLLLREALHNLIANAVEACAEVGGGRVAVGARPVASGGAPVIEIEVVDTGPGIPPADLPRLFSPGFTTKKSGSGIGLAVAERAVEAHHGRILIDSEVGRGTRVTVLLPTDLAAFARLAPLGAGGGGE